MEKEEKKTCFFVVKYYVKETVFFLGWEERKEGKDIYM